MMENTPAISVFPRLVWNDDNLFCLSFPEGKKSKPEYGLSLSDKNIPKLESFRLGNSDLSFIGYVKVKRVLIR